MVEAAGQILQLGGERAAEHHIELLKAAADAQERHAALDHLRDQLQGQPVAQMVIGLVPLGRHRPIMRRMDIRYCAGHHHSIQPVEQAFEIEIGIERRDHDRDAPRHLRHGPQIFVTDRVEGESPVLEGVGGSPTSGLASLLVIDMAL